MKIFGKTTKENDFTDIDEELLKLTADRANTLSGAEILKPENKSNYSIDDAIALIKGFSQFQVNTSHVAEIMVKTLESTNVSVHEILTSARDKESQLQYQSHSIKQNINTLLAEINSQKEKLLETHGQLKDVVKVREILEETGTAHTAVSNKADEDRRKYGPPADFFDDSFDEISESGK